MDVDYWAASALVKEFVTTRQHRDVAEKTRQTVVIDDEGDEEVAENEGEEDEHIHPTVDHITHTHTQTLTLQKKPRSASESSKSSKNETPGKKTPVKKR